MFDLNYQVFSVDIKTQGSNFTQKCSLKIEIRSPEVNNYKKFAFDFWHVVRRKNNKAEIKSKRT